MNAINLPFGGAAVPAVSRPGNSPWTWARARQVLTWKRWAYATALGTLLGVLVPLQNLHINFYFTPWKIVYQTPFYLAFAWVFLLAIAGVEASVPRGEWPSPWRYVSGAVAASLACVGLAWALSDQMRMAPERVISGGSSLSSRTIHLKYRENIAVFEIGFDGVVHGWLATFIYVALRNARRAARALSEAEIERSEAHRALLASQLEAAHAEIDPEDVFRALANIEEAYEEDPARADALLDDLIAFLRSAIPHLRCDAHTLEAPHASARRPG
jgi:hypothetical protein